MKKKIMYIAVIYTFLVIIFAATAFAATPESIKNVSVTINETKEDAGVVWQAEPKVSSKKYYIEDYSWSKEYENWIPGSKISLTITLAPSEGYHFDTKVKYNVSGGEIASKKRDSAQKISMHINYIPCVILSSPSGIYFEEDWLLKWDKVDYAGGYKITIYKDGSSYKTVETEGKSSTQCDLSPYCTDDECNYTVKIKAVAPKGKSNYIKSSDSVNFDEDITSGESTTSGEFIGSGANLKFKTVDSGYAQGWQQINGSWYYFDPNNNNKAIVSQWAQLNSKWYYFDENGRMQTGWLRDSTDFWYYLDIGNGDMKTGWVSFGPDGPWYYFNPGTRNDYPYGAMLTNTVTPDGYRVDATGKWDGTKQ